MIIKEISSLQNETIKHLVRLREKKEYRKEQKSVVISGITEIKELFSNPLLKLHFKTLLSLDKKLIPPHFKADDIFIVPQNVLQKASGLIKPEGLLAEIEMPKESSLTGLNKILALDRVKDPGNLGTLLRSALALNFDGIFILEGSTDPFNDKALSAARGATFSLPIREGNWDDLKKIIVKNNLNPLVADIQGRAVEEIIETKKILLILSHETTGPSKTALEVCERVTIPISSKMESLNVGVAGGILMYMLGKEKSG